MNVTTAMARRLSTLASLDDAADALEQSVPERKMLDTIAERDFLKPAENEAIGFWFARYLSVRYALRELVDELIDTAGKHLPDADDYDEWCVFIIGYATACQLVRLDRLMLFHVADSSTMQRKLNEPFDEYRIPRKQYTLIFRSFVDQRDALIILDAIRHLRRYRARLTLLANDALVGALVQDLDRREQWLDTSKRNYLKRFTTYLSHATRRRGVVAMSQALAQIMEGFGRTASNIGGRTHKRIDDNARRQLAAMLKPGDMLVTRHDHVLTNLFLPGFWPHVALHIGTSEERDKRCIELDPERQARWSGDLRVLEALKDGVRFRSLSETLAVDHLLVLRPRLDNSTINVAIARACKHEGKPYNFDFDFFNADRLVCTEVVYRAFDGLDGMDFPLTLRASRQTLSAEDLVAFALNSDLLEPVALLSAKLDSPELLTGSAVRQKLLTATQPDTDN
ncbi:MAG: YiiX/YebB-like N1pC/P60 family cysteine hydrolase [Granulosicoccus sp.]